MTSSKALERSKKRCGRSASSKAGVNFSSEDREIILA